MDMFSVEEKKSGAVAPYYLSLCFVIFVWGMCPVINPYIYTVFSPTVCSGIGGLAAALSLVIMNFKNLKMINADYLKIAIPTGIINSVASIIQKIGLLYTTPARYAFLENLSCVVVPVMMFFLVRKKPGAIKIIASVLCLFGCFMLAGADTSCGMGVGELLCSLSGILYGFNIALTAVYATKLISGLYVLLHMVVHVFVSFAATISLNYIEIGGTPIEPMRFEWNFEMLAIIVVVAILSNTLCWTLRTDAMKHIDATIVAVMMPFSAVVTGLVSVALGLDSISYSFVIGALIVLLASILSGLGDLKINKRH
ncbi:MAG: DMT family transporter [Clostridia bacterium]|nr:DMT family transporter [Clostridia bacterium]